MKNKFVLKKIADYLILYSIKKVKASPRELTNKHSTVTWARNSPKKINNQK